MSALTLNRLLKVLKIIYHWFCFVFTNSVLVTALSKLDSKAI